MKDLEKYYSRVDNLKYLGIDYSYYEKQMQEEEEKLIKEGIANIIKENIEPLFRRINRELLYVIEFHPEKGLRVNSSQKKRTNEKKPSAQQIEPPLNEHICNKSEFGSKPPFYVDDVPTCSEKIYEIRMKSGVRARAICLVGNRMKILKGSCISGETVPSFQLRDLRREILRKCERLPDGSYRLLEDVCFNSPSAAAKIVLGNSSSGLKYWKTTGGRSLKDIVEKE